ncbi:methyltransferase domain-containing protein [Paenibacillus mesophilus]|uniref:class I SAM-dependent methyltransferase n=1 Tax=Paenibacillus mesophilus TaxID=2582849 RepID=UPI00110DF2B2|nr:class I SAM-dependent methyltransferase [Paenibacillus mesophilus]TMV45966.1 methyltransferase domain-containing protein [Paenibacillus mesophilus]
MGDFETNSVIKNAWNSWSDKWYDKYGTADRIGRIMNNPETAFHQTTFSLISKYYPDLKGKKVCVPASGDNHAVFAFCLMGAQVTSVDLSERQLENAARIAREIGLHIEFVCEDCMRFDKIKRNEYDLVYTSNGVHTWISDLPSMYRNFHGVLKDEGLYVMYDVHPFMRPFEENTETIAIRKPYDATGPFTELSTYHWRMEDIMNALADSGFCLQMIKESYAEYDTFWHETSGTREGKLDRLYDWKQTPLMALPQWLSLCARKRAEG